MPKIKVKPSRRAARWIGVFYPPCRRSIRLALHKIKFGDEPEVDLWAGKKNVRVRYW